MPNPLTKEDIIRGTELFNAIDHFMLELYFADKIEQELAIRVIGDFAEILRHSATGAIINESEL